MANPLEALHAAGQSIWYDNIRRGLLTSGEMQRLIDDDFVTGITANPTIFEKAITGSSDYDFAIEDLAGSGLTGIQVYERLATADVRTAADMFRPIYERTGGADGFVSIEVSPELAHDTQGSIDEARRFWAEVNRPNVMVKIPGTPEGYGAVEELLAEGMNINITLLFSVEAYDNVVESYLRALERRVAAGQPIDKSASVASFFVSRIDTLVDKMLESKLKDDPSRQELFRGLQGQVAVANAKVAYEHFQDAFGGERFAALRAKGARVQRPLWASTSTKNPAYGDVMYVEELIGPDTVDTMPPQTIVAFRDHGKVARTVDADFGHAHAVMHDLQEAGISIEQVTAQVLEEGVKSFSDSFVQLAAGIEEKLAALATGSQRRQSLHLFDQQAAVDSAVRDLDQAKFVHRAWDHDPTAWTPDENAAGSIRSRLGWLNVTDQMIEQLPAIQGFADEVRTAGYKHVVVLGMGGSSLGPEVLQHTFGVREGYPELKVLDSTDPRAVRDAASGADPATTLYIVSSKSGTTTEPNDFFAYFWEKVERAKGAKAGENFAAITDPGTPLQQLAEQRGFRKCFLNPPDIGGRYSVLSYFGVVPAALMGIDVSGLLARAQRMEQGCVPVVPTDENAGVILGAAMGTLATEGRNKVSFVCSPGIGSFGLWLEQLLAESTGKEGTGLIPVAGEPLGGPEVYGDDRLFVYLRLSQHADAEQDRAFEALEAAKQPQVRISLNDPLDLGQEFFRWEMATATAGSILRINPFDEPNVQESKDNTNRLLAEFDLYHKLAQPKPAVSAIGVALVSGRAMENGGPASVTSAGELVAALRIFLGAVRPGDYVALMAYVNPTDTNTAALQRLRTLIRNRLKVATTAGFGPRFLHSTGQLHKGGPDSGVFIQITGVDGADLAVPGRQYSFQTLIDAQALGDLQSLQQHGRRVIRLDLGRDVAAGLPVLESVVAEALG